MKPDLIILKDVYGIYQFTFVPELWEQIENSDFYSFTKTGEEISIVCKQSVMHDSVQAIADKNWKIIKFLGPLSLSLTGIIAEVAGLLGKSKIPVFAVSTYNTDYILVKQENIDNAMTVLSNNGYRILYE